MFIAQILLIAALCGKVREVFSNSNERPNRHVNDFSLPTERGIGTALGPSTALKRSTYPPLDGLPQVQPVEINPS
jgi:hypothetical protein